MVGREGRRVGPLLGVPLVAATEIVAKGSRKRRFARKERRSAELQPKEIGDEAGGDWAGRRYVLQGKVPCIFAGAMGW